jgi:hypothetical protein
MGPQFHDTGYGRKFFERDLPELINAINRLANAVEQSNKQSSVVPEKKDNGFGSAVMK